MATPLPHHVDTAIIGIGPSALILSYILHGHIPYYVGGHQDAILDSKLTKEPNLLNLSADLYAHFLSSLRYSTQALPVNTLLDTLIRPNADTELNPKSCIEWRYEPERAISHIAIGQTPHAGGQWAENPVSASANIGTLSYAEQLSLPGYSYAEHMAKSSKGDQCDFIRPTRTEFAEYLRAYPAAVGISDTIVPNTRVDNVYRTPDGFFLGSLGIRCKHLVLASGIFTVNILPPPLLAPIAHLDSAQSPLLVIGSGFTAADVIISTPPTRKIIHIFQWAPDTRPSPLRGCHHTAYPEYAAVYRQMKLAAITSSKSLPSKSLLVRRKSNPYILQRDWSTVYEGLPNAEILGVTCSDVTGTATITIRLSSGDQITRDVGAMQYVVGRRGSLNFLSPDLAAEVLGTDSTQQTPALISGRTLRAKAESSLEVAKNVFITGSLAGDSLIRHAVGGCVFAAGRILGTIPPTYSPQCTPSPTSSTPRSISPSPASETGPPSSTTSVSRGQSLRAATEGEAHAEITNGHADLHVDRRKLTRAVEVANAENRFWVDSGWWAGGPGLRRT